MDLDRGSSPVSGPRPRSEDFQAHVPRSSTPLPGLAPEAHASYSLSPELEDNPNVAFHSAHASPFVVRRSGEHLGGLPGRSPEPIHVQDWIVPKETVVRASLTIGERLEPTLKNAQVERAHYARKAQMAGYALNVAIGLQVLFGALTTALSASNSGRRTSIGLSVIGKIGFRTPPVRNKSDHYLTGGMSTLVASYLARARGSNEPELSIIRAKDLDQFIRECEAFKMDFGHLDNHEHDEKLERFRSRFEELLGNANGERRLATV
ncbi:hypothetical protein BDP27DRAFT_1331313 [Rhodocollybia butyracea]|uniref:SMODS and SLOG-associating 2TM effector domain-containing protein n=1 Tax=Rhodocollybia butyracea TaxID=206335 RepID=A0A9P5PPU9_9AGAR|nr:hypothetical protein BDP27DRAFT_1331313 [Rhodocollybia butyracea]